MLRPGNRLEPGWLRAERSRAQPISYSGREPRVKVSCNGAVLDGDLVLPAPAQGLVLFAHGSGSSRHSPRNRYVAAGLNRAGFGTLLLDLLTEQEEQIDLRTRQWRFAIPLLSRRVVAAVDQLSEMPDTQGLPIAVFGASTGAAAALRAAAARPAQVQAVLSRGGRPDLAADDLPRVTAPVLLIVGGEDPEVAGLNVQAADRLGGVHEVALVPGATHLFEEPGALDRVIALSTAWLDRWVVRPH